MFTKDVPVLKKNKNVERGLESMNKIFKFIIQKY